MKLFSIAVWLLCGSGSEAADSMLHEVWSPTPDTCSLSTPPSTAAFRVSVGRTVDLHELTSMQLADAGHAFVFPNGDLQVKVSYGANRSKAIRSNDGGRTWRVVPQAAPPFENRTSSEFGQNSVATSWGEVLTFSEFGDHVRAGPPWIKPPSANGSIAAEMLVSTDNGLTQTSRTTLLYLPPALKLTNMAHAGMVELADHSLLSYSYAHWKGIDGYGVAWPVSNKSGAVGAPKDRTFVMRSTDHGLSFTYLSTVAFDSTNNSRTCALHSDPFGSNPACAVLEGFNEPVLSALSNPGAVGGLSLQMIMRSGGSQAVAPTGVVNGPMYRSFSMDAGQTWSIAQQVADRGVTPTAAHAGNVHVVGYGRPADWLMFSADGGVSYTHWCYHDGGGSRYDGSNYNSLVLLPRADGDAHNEFRLMTSYYNGSVLATFVIVRVS